MRRQITLYIAGQQVDLDEQSFILFNYTMEELTNPTIVRNSFSKQVVLKGTARNNRVFGGIYRLDRVTRYGDSYGGVYFDPTRKTPFVIYNERSEIVESGYVKLDEVVKKRDAVEYKVTLFGGLGSFFYGLMYDEDGNKKTLASLRYRTLDGGYTSAPGHMGQVGGYSMLRDCWLYLEDPQTYAEHIRNGDVDCWWAHIVNFAPAYNGLPEDFSADKAVCNKPFDNVPNQVYLDPSGENMPIPYSFKTGTRSNLMLFTKPHSEWEIKDLRWYLQRPVFSIRELLNAICDKENNGGYDVELSPAFDNEDNILLCNGWVTLPLIPAEDRSNANALPLLLANTKSPVEYLISLAKIYGLVFLYDNVQKKITIMTRQEFFSTNDDFVDLTKRADINSIAIQPVLGQSHFYQFGGGAVGEWAEDYKKEYGIDYGIQRVNTGNEFNSDTKVLTSDLAFKDAVEVQERNLLFTSNYLSMDAGGGVEEIFILPKYEGVKLQVWGTPQGESEQQMEEVDILAKYERDLYFDNPDYPLSDWLPKVQMHGKDNKSVDGSDIILVFNGVKETPRWTSRSRLQYRLTDDTPDMAVLNEGTPCWNFTQENMAMLTSLPSFRRCHTASNDAVIDATWEWGEPKARGVNGVAHEADAHTIYNEYWKAYLSDRYDDDTFIMKCKVNLRGLDVGQSLMRRFFYYQGALFSLNKITNHSLTTWDDTECEFIKVQNINNYRR